MRVAAHRDINCLRSSPSLKPAPASVGRGWLFSMRANRRMGGVRIHQRQLRMRGFEYRSLASSGSVEPEHWHLACERISPLQEAGPKCEAGIRFGGMFFAAREVPQSTPDETDGGDYRNN